MFNGILGARARKTQIADAALAKILIRRADAARDEKRFREAGALYAEAIRLGAAQGGIRVQAGHMHKEAGDLEAAERFYLDALALMPRDADLALQLGHFYKTAGRLRDAQFSYHRALELRPEWREAELELANLTEGGWAAGASGEAASVIGFDPEVASAELVRNMKHASLVPELMPLAGLELLIDHGESIHFRRLGRMERTYWGDHLTLRGVEAIRGFCIAADPIVEMQILLNGLAIYRGPVRGYPLKQEPTNAALRKYVFNVWLDLQNFAPGRYALEVRFYDASGARNLLEGRRLHRQDVVIAPPLPEPVVTGGDGWTPPTDPADPRSVDEQINARPSVTSEARRTLLPKPPENILVLRTDQLGDVVISVPAMQRLRALFPTARIVGLFTSANADLARTLGTFDEIIVVNFPDEKDTQRKRVMTAEDQAALRERLAPYYFDLALDLAPAVQSRPLLRLSGAPLLAGMKDGQWPYLNVGFDFNTYDPVGRSDVHSASARTLAFVEALGVLSGNHVQVLRRPELSRDRLEQFGIAADEDYVIVHTGARVVFSRWGHYPELSERLLARTPHKVVMLSENPETRSQLPASLLEHERFQLLDRRLAFDDFDALLSYCRCFVGNDSGPKHLASLRGSNVVSLHTARVNWGEWAQEHTGKVIHRQVPCAACHIYSDPEECGRDYQCVTLISVDEVWEAMKVYLDAR